MQAVCVICHDPFDGAVGIVTTQCGHIFHNSCIEKWLARSGTCPECRNIVFKESLTKLFFNVSFDDKSGNNIERSLDELKKQLHEKDLAIIEKDKKIKKLQAHCALSEKGKENMHQNIMELQNQLNILKRKNQRIVLFEARNQLLLHERNMLQSELEHLNNIKIIVEASSNDTTELLRSMQVHEFSEEGNLAFSRLATYCSVIKRELSSCIEVKNQLQNELTQVKRKMGILQAENEQIKRQLEKQNKTIEDLNSALSERESTGSHSIPIPPCSPTAECRNFDKSVLLCKDSSFSTDIPENKRRKMNIVVVDRHPKAVILGKKITAEAPGSRLTNVHAARRYSSNEDSVSRVGYNGLGGHGCIVIGSGKKKVSFRKKTRY
ncbi:E3 ubiquitin-protein ligase TRAIP-like [Argiope bruennichi]|uniref:E3 ubiquitin-protein ligase TRAIP like protein n=1 Tax=Argiope bruennichi TaxID=94029 RepID=A0A8T0EZQ8_ARGBR|nr:E3 ubiquitin-protein ligase TRAIP-like [Argiope bruennichi]KAF8784287.1 E3 ubiquitin-protein ligase TRAIP like protein [Argiope bruennichi]